MYEDWDIVEIGWEDDWLVRVRVLIRGRSFGFFCVYFVELIGVCGGVEIICLVNNVL